MPFLDHLEELRWRILWSVLAVLVGSAIGFYLVNRYQVMELLIDPIRPYLGSDERLGYLSPTDPSSSSSSFP
jgi:sec-independent protein translocase protein TatC